MRSHISKKQHRGLTRYLTYLADQMGLTGWRIEVSPRPAEDANYAECHITAQSQHAQILVCTDLFDLDPVTIKRVLVHELIHCHYQRMTDVLESVQTNLGDHAWGVMFECFRQQLELSVDNVAVAWAAHIDDTPVAKHLRSKEA